MKTGPLPTELLELQTLARQHKRTIFLVGGFLRDLVVAKGGLGSRDFDFAVDQGAIELAHTFADRVHGAFVLLDKSQGCARVAKKKGGVLWTFDFAEFRASTLQGDLKGRDFTINTLVVDLLQLDLTAGVDSCVLLKACSQQHKALADIKDKTIRMVAPHAFQDDPLRLMRAFSLKAQLGFKIEPQTLKAVRRQVTSIQDVSIERVREELFKVLKSPRAARTLKAMDRSGLLTQVMPQIEVMRDVAQGGYHHLDVWQHSLEALVQLEKLVKTLRKNQEISAYLNEELAGGHPRLAVLKLACLWHDIGKPDTKKRGPEGRTLFHGHEHAGRRIATVMAKKLMLSTKERHAIEDMVTMHLRPGYLSNFKKPSERMFFRYLRDAKDNAIAIALLSFSDQLATRGPLTTDHDVAHHERIAFEIIERYFEKRKKTPFRRLISGHDLVQQLGMTPGPVFMKVLTSVEEAQHLGKVTTKAEALAWAKTLL